MIRLTDKQKEGIRARIEHREKQLSSFVDVYLLAAVWYQEYISSTDDGAESIFMRRYCIRKIRALCYEDVEVLWMYFNFFEEIGQPFRVPGYKK